MDCSGVPSIVQASGLTALEEHPPCAGTERLRPTIAAASWPAGLALTLHHILQAGLVQVSDVKPAAGKQGNVNGMTAWQPGQRAAQLLCQAAAAHGGVAALQASLQPACRARARTPCSPRHAHAHVHGDGAGGGSWVDELYVGQLQLGPHGRPAYGQGNTQWRHLRHRLMAKCLNNT